VRPFIAAWIVFWLLLMTVAVQDHLRQGAPQPWLPLFYEGTSCLVASVMAWLLWPGLRAQDSALAQPWRWLARPLAMLVPLALAFVAAVYAIRHGAFALAGARYRHAPWPEVLLYEGVKFALFYLLFVALIFGLRSFAALQAQRLAAEASRRLAREAQLTQLAQQIEPHFLFNALNTVASLIPEDPATAERLVMRLSSLLRVATDLTRQPQVRLAVELDLLAAYVEIMLARFGSRVQVHWHIEPELRAVPVPALILQPLVENAFRHGVERHPGPVNIAVEARRDAAAAMWVLAVSCDRGELAGAAQPGTGLATVQQRLRLAYGPHAALNLGPAGGGGVRCALAIPWPAGGPEG
jgi:sensor histidine kinase YesM